MSMGNGSEGVETWRYDQLAALGLFAVWMITEVARTRAIRFSRLVYNAGLAWRVARFILLLSIFGSLLLVLVLDVTQQGLSSPSIFAVVTGMVLAQVLDRQSPQVDGKTGQVRRVLQDIFLADKTRFGQDDVNGPGLFIVRYDWKLKRGPHGRSTWRYHLPQSSDDDSTKSMKKITKDERLEARADLETQRRIRQILSRSQEADDNVLNPETVCGDALYNWLPTNAHDYVDWQCKGKWDEEKSMDGHRRGMLGFRLEVDHAMSMSEWCIRRKREFYCVWFAAFWSSDMPLVLVNECLPAIARHAVSHKEVVRMLEACMWRLTETANRRKSRKAAMDDTGRKKQLLMFFGTPRKGMGEVPPSHRPPQIPMNSELDDYWWNGILDVQAERSDEERQLAERVRAVVRDRQPSSFMTSLKVWSVFRRNGSKNEESER